MRGVDLPLPNRSVSPILLSIISLVSFLNCIKTWLSSSLMLAITPSWSSLIALCRHDLKTFVLQIRRNLPHQSANSAVWSMSKSSSSSDHSTLYCFAGEDYFDSACASQSFLALYLEYGSVIFLGSELLHLIVLFLRLFLSCSWMSHIICSSLRLYLRSILILSALASALSLFLQHDLYRWSD